MANFNGKGPEEKGPRTGRGLGKCNKEHVVSEEWYDKPRNGEGYHFGRGYGRGRGYGNGHGGGHGYGRGHGHGGGRGRGNGRGRW